MKIKEGNLDYIYILTSETILKEQENFEKYIKLIAKNKLRISADNLKGEQFFTNAFEEEVQERIKKHRETKNTGKKASIILEKNIQLDDTVKVSISANGFNIYDESQDFLFHSQVNSLERLEKLLNTEMFYTGFNSKDSKNRFVIRPPEILISSKTYIPTIILTLFKSGHIILHFSLELKDIEAKEISSQKWDIDIDEILYPKDILKGKNNLYKKTSFLSCVNKYILYFQELFDIEKPLDYFFQHITLYNYSYKPDIFSRKLSKGFEDGIYRILFAPVFKHQLHTEEICREILEQQIYRFSQNYVMYVNYNRIISCISKGFNKDIEEQLLFNGINRDEIKNLEVECEDIYRTVLVGTINNIEDILIKKANSALINYTQLSMDMPLNQLLDIEIMETKLYLNNYYKYFYEYESLNRLSKFIEEKSESYLRFGSFNERKEKIESILQLRKEKLIYNATLLGPLLTIILTTLLSYSALESITKAFAINISVILIYIIINIIFDVFLIIVFKTQFKELFYLLNKQIDSSKKLFIINRGIINFKKFYKKIKNIIF